MHKYLQPVYSEFKENANAEYAEGMKAYMLHQFTYFGIKAPLRDQISKAYLKTNQLNGWAELENIVKECWLLPEREMLYFAIDILGYHKKLWKPSSSIKLIEFCLTSMSWWDSVDGIASDWLGYYFKTFPEQIIPITGKWNQSKNIWLQRSSIMFQKTYKQSTDTALLSKYILNCSSSKEFFIQKAIGWALREYSKTDGDWVLAFVAKHPLAPLSKREALKRLGN
jgi:3-methyladenine DNA glycosylase AlkD